MAEINETAHEKAKANYRLEMFLSVDVSGSTAFKFSRNMASAGTNAGEDKSGWFTAIRKFYDSFHEKFHQCVRAKNLEATPHLWKALGDELIYRITIADRHSAAVAMCCFIEAIHHTRGVVRAVSKGLDLKGCAWVADFDARNAVIDLDGLHDPYQQSDPGQSSARTSKQPAIQDFIGPSMDAGFRLAKAASRRRLPLSVELALILASAEASNRSYPLIFGYDGREEFKGVLGGETYPVVWLDIEDDVKLRETNRREAAMLQCQPEVPAETVVDFCKSYIESSYWMEMPYLKAETEGHFLNIPPSHVAEVIRKAQIQAKEQPLYSQASTAEDENGGNGITADQLVENMPTPTSSDPEQAQ